MTIYAIICVMFVNQKYFTPTIESKKDTCAFISLFHLLSSQKKEKINASELLEKFPLPSVRGHSMRDIIEVARSEGVSLTGSWIDPTQFSIKEPAILFLEEDKHGHFITVLPVGNTGMYVQIIDGYKFPKTVHVKSIRSLPGWTGKALSIDHTKTKLIILVSISLSTIIMLIVFYKYTKNHRYSSK